MNLAETYRANAAAERTSAKKASLTNRRALHERSAIVWDEMADAAEEHLQKSTVNAAAKLIWCNGRRRFIDSPGAGSNDGATLGSAQLS